MAIKGKKRTRPRGPALPPRPSVTARKTPLPMRKNVKRGLVIVLSVLSLLGGLRVWQNVSRSDAVRTFNVKLRNAQLPLITHLDPNNPVNLSAAVDQFTKGQMQAKDFMALATQWETDFRTAVENVKKLKAPNPIANEAKVLMADGLDGYVGLARLYNLAGQMKQLADATKDAKTKGELNNKVQVILQHASEWKSRADSIYTVGSTKFDDLKDRYGVEKKIQQQQQTSGG